MKKHQNNDDNLLVSCKVLCEGKMHKISVHHNGRLVFHDHQREEIRRELQLVKLGGRCCRCAEVARMYITDQFGKNIPATFSYVRPSSGINTITWRMQRHIARKRGPDKYLLHINTDQNSVYELIQHVKSVLNERGYRTSDKTRVAHILNSRMASCSISFATNGVEIIRGDGIRLIAIWKNRSRSLVRFLADLCERQHFKELLAAADKRNEAKRTEYLNQLVENINENTEEWINVDLTKPKSALARVHLYIGSLTKAAACCIVKEIDKVQDKIEKIIKASRKRREATNRFPSPEKG